MDVRLRRFYSVLAHGSGNEGQGAHATAEADARDDDDMNEPHSVNLKPGCPSRGALRVPRETLRFIMIK